MEGIVPCWDCATRGKTPWQFSSSEQFGKPETVAKFSFGYSLYLQILKLKLVLIFSSHEIQEQAVTALATH